MHLSKKGFSLISAIFLIVIIGLVSGYLISITSLIQASTNLFVVQSKTYFASLSGLEWGARSIILNPTACPASPTVINFNDTGLRGTSVSVTCSLNTYNDGSTTLRVFTITGNASYGTVTNPEYAFRSLSTSIVIAN